MELHHRAAHLTWNFFVFLLLLNVFAWDCISLRRNSKGTGIEQLIQLGKIPVLKDTTVK